jgi:FLYWCH zinc finger domain
MCTFKTDKGKQDVSFNGFRYRFHKKGADGFLYWQCIDLRYCKGRLPTTDVDPQAIRRNAENTVTCRMENWQWSQCFAWRRTLGSAKETKQLRFQQSIARRQDVWKLMSNCKLLHIYACNIYSIVIVPVSLRLYFAVLINTNLCIAWHQAIWRIWMLPHVWRTATYCISSADDYCS